MARRCKPVLYAKGNSPVGQVVVKTAEDIIQEQAAEIARLHTAICTYMDDQEPDAEEDDVPIESTQQKVEWFVGRMKVTQEQAERPAAYPWGFYCKQGEY